eukprot:1189261-Rhodomonas_salina.1
MVLHRHCAVSGTEIRVVDMVLILAGRLLRACYAVSGTESGYGATRLVLQRRRVCRRVQEQAGRGTALCFSYAMSAMFLCNLRYGTRDLLRHVRSRPTEYPI